ncbi:MAG: hypothetical protein IKM61_08880 [Eubacteriaceae bacterium]|nr:hypothetical protein [Eubacteriaceae bacterium]
MDQNTLRIIFYAVLLAGIILRIIAMGIFLSVRNVTMPINIRQVYDILSREEKSLYLPEVIFKAGRSIFYAYSEPLNIQTNEMTMKCGEDSVRIYDAATLTQRFFLFRSASIKRAHFNFSRIMSFFIGLFSVVSLFIVSLGSNLSDMALMQNGMMIYLVTVLCSIVTSDFDIFASLDAVRYIENNRALFSVNHYYAKRVLYGHILHKLSRAHAVFLLPAGVIIGLFL